MHFLIPEHLLCIQLLHLMHKMKFLSTFLLQTEHGSLEASIVGVLSPIHKASVFFTFTFNPFSVTALCHHMYVFSTSFQLSPSRTKPSAYESSFTPPSLKSFVISSITTANK